MSVIAKEPEGKGIENPTGTHQSVCYAIWDLGFQKVTYNNNDKSVHKIIIAFELNKRIYAPESEYHNRRYSHFAWYTLSLFRNSNLRKDLVAWRGRDFTKEELEGFDLEKCMGANCLLNLTENPENGFVNMASIMKLPANTPLITPENPPDPPQFVLDKQNNQFIIDQEIPVIQRETNTTIDKNTEDLVVNGSAEKKCKCGRLLKSAEIESGKCIECDLPF